MHGYYNLCASMPKLAQTENRSITKRGRVGMIGGGLAPFGVVLDRLRGSIAPMHGRGGVVGH